MKKGIAKRVIAAVGLLVIVAMYVFSFVAAICARPQAKNLFMLSLALTILVPVLMYCLLKMIERREQMHKEGMTVSELRKYNKRLKNGESPEKLASEIMGKYEKKGEKKNGRNEGVQAGNEGVQAGDEGVQAGNEGVQAGNEEGTPEGNVEEAREGKDNNRKNGKYCLNLNSMESLFEGAKKEYREGEKVELIFGVIATDTDYQFFKDGEKIPYEWDGKRNAFVIRFRMPAHDVSITLEARNTMVKND